MYDFWVGFLKFSLIFFNLFFFSLGFLLLVIVDLFSHGYKESALMLLWQCHSLIQVSA